MKVIDFKTGKEKINIQIKQSPQIAGENYSKSLTLLGMSVEEAFNRIQFMFEQLSKNNSNVVIKHYKINRSDMNDKNENFKQ